jgi:hypothetical protein
MIIVYQIRSKLAKTVEIENIGCPQCHNKGGLKMYFYQKYTWLIAPMLPAGKSAILDCTFCNQSISTKNWTKELHIFFKIEKRNMPIPFRYFSGFIFCILLFLVPLVLVKAGISNPFHLKDDSAKIEQARIDQALIKENDYLFVGLINNERNLKFKVVKVVKTEGNETAIIRQSIKTYNQFQDQYDLNSSNFSETDFETDTKKINLTYLRKSGSIEEVYNNSKPHIAIMRYYAIIK